MLRNWSFQVNPVLSQSSRVSGRWEQLWIRTLLSKISQQWPGSACVRQLLENFLAQTVVQDWCKDLSAG